jgi:hypothetical protein
MEVQCREQSSESSWRPLYVRCDGAQAGSPSTFVIRVVREQSESQQDVGCDRRAGGRGVVEKVTGTGDQLLVVAAGVVEALDVVVPEQVDHLVRQADGAAQVEWLERCLVEREQAVGEHRVVLEVAVYPRDAVPSVPRRAGFQLRRGRSSGIRSIEEEVGVASGRLAVAYASSRPARLRRRRAA